MSGATGPVLAVSNLTVDFLSDQDPVHAVRSVSFDVRHGETLVILGESGSGKSVSTSAVMNLIDCPPGEVRVESMTFEGNELAAMTARQRRDLNGRGIAMIFQDPLAHLNPVFTIGRQIAEVFEAHGVASGREARKQAVELLERVGIANAVTRIDQYPHQFSGGQRQRIMIAMALALKPAVLIADEPTTALDLSVQAQILDLLRDLQRESGMALVLITHDLDVAAAMADRVIVMKDGEIVEEGNARDLFENPRHPYTQQLMSALPGEGGPSRQFSSAGGETILQVRGLTKEYLVQSGIFGGGRTFRAVDDVSFALAQGETLGVVGESGSGKSSVARMLLRLNEPTAGQALFHGKNLFEMGAQEMMAFRRRVQMVFQDPYGSMNPRMTVFEIVSEAWRIHRDVLPREKWSARVGELLEMVGLLASHAGRYPHQFSGGQRQRIAIARALASEPELIVCDEAVSALDISVQVQVIELLADLRTRLGLSYIFITHDLPIVRNFADRILVMKAGKVVDEGPTATVFDNPAHPYTRELVSARPIPKWVQPGTLMFPVKAEGEQDRLPGAIARSNGVG